VKHVSTTWTLGDARLLPSYEGWQEIRILSPNDIVSKRATFKLTCNDLETARKPDLVISEASLALGQICLPHHPILLATALVKNIGDATSPERCDVGLVGAIEDSSGWGNGIGLPALSPGSTHRVEFPIYYLIDNRAYCVEKVVFIRASDEAAKISNNGPAIDAFHALKFRDCDDATAGNPDSRRDGNYSCRPIPGRLAK
jgi:hypothetical protein